MTLISHMFLSLVCWALAAAVFETAFERASQHRPLKAPKTTISTVFWAFLGLLALCAGPSGLVHALAIVPVGLAHVRLCRHYTGPLPVRDVLKKIWAVIVKIAKTELVTH